MQNDVLPHPLGPLMMHVKGCLNMRSSHITDLWVLRKPLLNIAEWNGRIVAETPHLKKRDSVSLFFGLCDGMYLTVALLLLILRSVCNVTVTVSSPLNTRALMTSKLTVWEAL